MALAASWTRENIAWAAGLFEGEGCITTQKGRAGRLDLISTDQDVIRKFYAIVGVGRVNGPYRPNSSLGHKPQWRWSVSGFENIQALLAAFWTFLCERRRKRAIEVLSVGVHMLPANKHRKLKDVCGVGHVLSEDNKYKYPNGRVQCKLCRKNYMSVYYKVNKDKWVNVYGHKHV